MGPEQDSSVGTWEQSPIHEVGQTKSAFPPLRHSPENHWQAKHAGKDYVTSKVKRKKAECQAGSDSCRLGLPHCPVQAHPVGEQAIWCCALCRRQALGRWLTPGSGHQAVSWNSPWCTSPHKPPGLQDSSSGAHVLWAGSFNSHGMRAIT